jgi:hypothetical protein
MGRVHSRSSGMLFLVHMKPTRGFGSLILLLALAAVLLGGGVYLYSRQSHTVVPVSTENLTSPATQNAIVTPVASTTDTFDYESFLPGKTYVMTCATPGGKGVLNPDHTLIAVYPMEYVANDTRPNHSTGQWSLKGNVLTLSGSGTPTVDLTLRRKIIDGKTIVLDNNIDDSSGDCGYVIGDSLDTIGLYLSSPAFSYLGPTFIQDLKNIQANKY